MSELSPYFIRRAGIPPPAEPVLLNEPLGEERSEPGFWDFWRVLRTRRRLIIVFFLAVVITVAVGTFLMTPIYTSEVTLLIEEKVPQVMDIRQVVSETVGTERHDYYATQAEVLRSAALAAQVIQEQQLERNKIFTGEEKSGIIASIKQWLKTATPVKGFLSSLRGSSDKTKISDPTVTLGRLTAIYLKNYLEIKPVENTHLIKIVLSSPDPDLSAQLANAHARAYIEQGLKFRARTSEKAERFLEENLVQLKRRLEQSEGALSNYRRDNGIISLGEKENVVVDRLSDLNKRLTEAEADRITLQAQVQLIRQRAFDSLPDVINNKLIQDLKSQLSRLEGDYANLSAEYTLAYPRLAQVKAQLDDARNRLNEQIRSVVGGIQSAFFAAEAKEKQLREKFAEQRNATLQLKDASVEYAILAREVDTNRQLYDSVLQRMKEMAVAADMPTSNTYIVDEGRAPLSPSRPKTTLNLLFGILLGAMGGVGLAFCVEYLDKTVSRPEEIERYFHLPTLAVVPEFSIAGELSEPTLLEAIEAKKSAEAHNDASFPSQPPLWLIGESYRSLQTSILLSQAEEAPRVVLFTSGMGGEGKTTTAINTAIVFAQMETKVLVIDADLRKPSCHNHLFHERASGLTELLTGHRTVKEVIKPTLADNLFVITAGAIPPDPAKLVGSRKMYHILTQLREQFDYIFIDSPPLIPVSDAVRLSTMVDGVVLLIKAQDTTRDMLKDACSRLRSAQAKILGMVLNQVDIRNGNYDYERRYYSATASPAVPL